MNRSILGLAVVLTAAFLPLAAFSQTSESTASQAAPASSDGSVAQWMTGERIASLRGQPFSAKVELETSTQLQDGTQITHKTYNFIARDSAGRTRNEMRNWIPPDGGEPRLIRIELWDPATRTRTDLFPLTKVVRQWVAYSSQTNSLVPRTNSKPEITKEYLGTDTMEGLPVKGTRVTVVQPAGAVGNDRPLSIVTENWFSPELRINLLTTKTDPRYGVQTVRLTELARSEPDAAMFAVAEDYKIVNDTAAVPVAPGSGALGESGVQTSTGASSSSAPNPALAGISRAGVKGVGVPRCVYCPNPSYTNEARAAKINGSVVLQVVVTAEGHAENISVLRKLGYGLDQSAIETVKNWQFQPAKGSDGNPVSTIVPVEVTFRIK
jgi:TonB family protein